MVLAEKEEAAAFEIREKVHLRSIAKTEKSYSWINNKNSPLCFFTPVLGIIPKPDVFGGMKAVVLKK